MQGSFGKTLIALALLVLSNGLGHFSASAQDDDCVSRGGHPLWFDTTSSIPYFGQQTGCAFGPAILNSNAIGGAFSQDVPAAILTFKNHPNVGSLPPGPQAAYVYCQKTGGRPIISYERPITSSSTAYTALADRFLNCQFGDGSQIEAQTLLKGPLDPSNAALAQALAPPAARMPAAVPPPSAAQTAPKP